MKCRLFKFWMNRALDDGRPLPARTERHLAGCTSCREHHRGQLLLIRDLQTDGKIEEPAASRASRLRTGTAALAVDAPDTDRAAEAAHPVQRAPVPSQFLRSRILNEITNSPPHSASVGFGPWVWAGGIAAMIALAVIVIQSQTKPASNLAAGNPAIEVSASNAATALFETTVRFANGGQLLQTATDLDQPLQTEMNLVISDARAALRSLQADFVPAQLLARSE